MIVECAAILVDKPRAVHQSHCYLQSVELNRVSSSLVQHSNTSASTNIDFLDYITKLEFRLQECKEWEKGAW
jgi:hypothetical protein